MPNRILREGILSSARVNALSPAAELFYRRLISVVDDYGRFHASPGTLRGACWPTCPDRVCDQDVSKWLAECAQTDSRGRTLIVLYQVDGCKYLQISDFKQQQRSKSKFPAPSDGCVAIANQLPCNCASLDVVEDEVDIRISQSQSETVSPLVGMTEYPKVLAAIQRKDPAADAFFANRLMSETFKHCMSSSKFPPSYLQDISDEVVARCVDESFRTGPPGHRAGLLLSRVPRIMELWSIEDFKEANHNGKN